MLTTLTTVVLNGAGNAVFARYPNGVVVHFSCMRDKSVCPVTQQRFGSLAAGAQLVNDARLTGARTRRSSSVGSGGNAMARVAAMAAAEVLDRLGSAQTGGRRSSKLGAGAGGTGVGWQHDADDANDAPQSRSVSADTGEQFAFDSDQDLLGRPSEHLHGSYDSTGAGEAAYTDEDGGGDGGTRHGFV